MRKPNPRETAMLVLLGVVVLVILFNFDWRSVGLGGGAGVADVEDKIGEAPVIRLSRLNQDPAGYDPKGRNLFEYGPPPRKKTAPRPMPKEPPPTRIERSKPTVPRPTVQREPPRPAAPRAPQPQFKYIGFMGPKENKIAVFDAGDETLLAQVGEVVQDQFLVREFKYRKVVLGYTDSRFAEQSAELEMKKPR